LYRAARFAILIGAAIYPAAAFANPGLDPITSLTFLGVTGVQVVLAIAVLAATPTRSVLTWFALILTLIGAIAAGVWEASLVFQLPAGIMILVAALGVRSRGFRFFAMAGTTVTAIALAYAIWRAQLPYWPFAASATDLSGHGPMDAGTTHDSPR
jgi:hypothetical protein